MERIFNEQEMEVIVDVLSAIGEQAIEDYKTLRRKGVIFRDGRINDAIRWTKKSRRMNGSKVYFADRRIIGMTKSEIVNLIWFIHSDWFSKLLVFDGIQCTADEVIRRIT